jgi:hypothetical protein
VTRKERWNLCSGAFWLGYIRGGYREYGHGIAV